MLDVYIKAKKEKGEFIIRIPQHGLEILQEVVKKEEWQMVGHCQAISRSSLLARNMAGTLSSP